MGGRKSRDKGNRVERNICDRLNKIGRNAKRVPNSGSSQGEFGGDLHFDLPVGSSPPLVRRATAEVKARRDGKEWKTVKGWLADYEALVLVQDRQEPLVVLPWSVFSTLMEGVSHGEARPSEPGRRERGAGGPDGSPVGEDVQGS